MRDCLWNYFYFSAKIFAFGYTLFLFQNANSFKIKKYNLFIFMEWCYTNLCNWIEMECLDEVVVVVNKLNFYRTRIKYLPPSIGLLQNVTIICFSKISLFVLPPEIGLLQKLRFLDISCNNLTFLPREIGQITTLKHLNCSENDLKFLPSSIGLLQNLQILYCNENELTTFPSEIGLLQKLEILSCPQNNIKYLPTTFINLKNVTVIRLDNDHLTHLTIQQGIFLIQKCMCIFPNETFDETFIKNLNYKRRKNVLLFAESIKNENTIISVVFGNLLRPICEFI